MRRGCGAIPYVIVCAVVSLVATACTGSDVTASRADFRKQANAICAAADAKAAGVVSPTTVDGPAIASTVASVVAIERKALGQLRALFLPPADAVAIRRWYSDVRRTIDATAAIGTASGKGDFAAATAARDRGNGYAATADATARSLGLERCATPADAPPATGATG